MRAARPAAALAVALSLAASVAALRPSRAPVAPPPVRVRLRAQTLPATSTRTTSPEVRDGFVRARGASLVRDGVSWRGLGGNAFHLQESAARERLGVGGARGLAGRTLDAAASLGMRALRVAGFNDGPRDVVALQRRRGVVDPRGVAGLDLVVEGARARGLGLVVVLSNAWSDYGGAAQYLRWRRIPAREAWRLYTDPGVRDDLTAWARALVTHVNPRTGLRYCDDPTIVAWEVMNEPRGDGLRDRGEAVTALLVAVAREVRARCPRQLVLAGDEGFDVDDAAWREDWPGASALGWIGPLRHESATRLAASAAFDAVTAHLYPEAWGVAPGDAAAWGERWITSHARMAARHGKALLVTEMGVRDPRLRAPVLARWLEASRRTPNVALAMPWGLSVRGLPGRDDGYRWRADDAVGRAVRAHAAGW